MLLMWWIDCYCVDRWNTSRVRWQRTAGRWWKSSSLVCLALKWGLCLILLHSTSTLHSMRHRRHLMWRFSTLNTSTTSARQSSALCRHGDTTVLLPWWHHHVATVTHGDTVHIVYRELMPTALFVNKQTWFTTWQHKFCVTVASRKLSKSTSTCLFCCRHISIIPGVNGIDKLT